MNIKTLNDLIEALQEIASYEDKDGNPIGELPVCIAHQQNWPLAEAIEAITVSERDGNKVWIATSPRYDLDYAPRNAWNNGIEGVDWEEEEY